MNKKLIRAAADSVNRDLDSKTVWLAISSWMFPLTDEELVALAPLIKTERRVVVGRFEGHISFSFRDRAPEEDPDLWT